jgi:hypothetical protein
MPYDSHPASLRTFVLETAVTDYGFHGELLERKRSILSLSKPYNVQPRHGNLLSL